MRGRHAPALALQYAMRERLALRAELIAPAAVEVIEHVVARERQIEGAGEKARQMQRVVALVAHADLARDQAEVIERAVGENDRRVVGCIAQHKAQGVLLDGSRLEPQGKA